MPQIIAITGGIGTGKSVVSQLLRVMGYTVYDCDLHAKRLMTADPHLRQQLVSLFGAEAYLTDTLGQPQLNRPYISQRMFADTELLTATNACVHRAVASDLLHEAESCVQSLYFFESAILFESGFDKLVTPHQVWTVSAPLDLRITRAMQRDHATLPQIESRIQAQMSQEQKEHLAHHVILNDDRHSLIAQVQSLISQIPKKTPISPNP